MITAHETLTASADKAALRYVSVLAALRGLVLTRLTTGRLSAQDIRSVWNEALDVATTHFVNERAELSREIDEVTSQGVADARYELQARGTLLLSPDAPDELLSVFLSDAGNELYTQLQRDALAARESLRRAALQARILARSKRLPLDQAARHMAAGDWVQAEFFFRDRGGRAWPSQKFVRIFWRHTLLLAYVEAKMSTYAQHGIDRLRVVWPASNGEYRDRHISLTGSDGLPRFEDVRGEFFHPNSKATLLS